MTVILGLLAAGACGSPDDETAVQDETLTVSTADLPPLCEPLATPNRYSERGRLHIEPAKPAFSMGEVLEFIIERPADDPAPYFLWITKKAVVRVPNDAGLHLARFSPLTLAPGYYSARLVGVKNKKTQDTGISADFAIIDPAFGTAALPILPDSSSDASSFIRLTKSPFVSSPLLTWNELSAELVRNEWTRWLTRSFPDRRPLETLLGLKSVDVRTIPMPSANDIHDPLFLEAMRFRDWFLARQMIETRSGSESAVYGAALTDKDLTAGPGSAALVYDFFTLPEYDEAVVRLLAGLSHSPRIVLRLPPDILGVSRQQAAIAGVTDIWGTDENLKSDIDRRLIGDTLIDDLAISAFFPTISAGFPVFSPVAVLYSPASADAPIQAALQASGSDHFNSCKAWHLLLSDAGIRARTVLPSEIVGGSNALSKLKALILPRAVVLSAAERIAILEFVSNGGLVIADFAPAQFDEKGRPDETEWAAKLFAVDDRFSRLPELPEERRGRAVDPLTGAPVGIQGGSLYIRLHNVKPVGDAVALVESARGGAAVITRQFKSGGRSVYMNMDMSPYVFLRTEPAEIDYLPIAASAEAVQLTSGDVYGGAALRDVIRTIFAESGGLYPANIRAFRRYEPNELAGAGATERDLSVPAETVRLDCRAYPSGLLLTIGADRLDRDAGKLYRIVAPRILHWQRVHDGQYLGESSFQDIRLPSNGRALSFFLSAHPIVGFNGILRLADYNKDENALTVSVDVMCDYLNDEDAPSQPYDSRVIEAVITEPIGYPVVARCSGRYGSDASTVEFIFNNLPVSIDLSRYSLFVRDSLTRAGFSLPLPKSLSAVSMPVPSAEHGDTDAARATDAAKDNIPIPATVVETTLTRDYKTERSALNASVRFHFPAAADDELEPFLASITLPSGLALHADLPEKNISVARAETILLGSDAGRQIDFIIDDKNVEALPDSISAVILLTSRRTGQEIRIDAVIPVEP